MHERVNLKGSRPLLLRPRLTCPAAHRIQSERWYGH